MGESQEQTEEQKIILETCREMGLDRWDAQIVEDMLGRPESAWPICCGSGCTPCSDDLAAAARRIKTRLAQRSKATPEGSPQG